MTRLSKLELETAKYGLSVNTYSPGDGVTRYRFNNKHSTYFADNGLYTALGIKEAMTFIIGYNMGKEYHNYTNEDNPHFEIY